VVRRELRIAGAGEEFTGFLRAAKAANTRRTEKDYGVLNFLPAKACERLGVFGEDAQGAAIGPSEKGVIFVCEWSSRGCELRLISHKKDETVPS
jgi:hypothetical protein